jgi:2-polyprenyl-3-methyl-5-hydroxy-6-metoxy-1,4-benzoquinol methylase
MPDLATTYPKPHEHSGFPDHLLRVAATQALGKWMVRDLGRFTAMDLSCGDGMIARSLGAHHVTLGDYANADYIDMIMPIEESLQWVTGSPKVDIFINCETLEHVDDPDAVLRGIRQVTDRLLLSTPIDAWQDDNPEHVWAWGKDEIDYMLINAGFQPYVYLNVDPRSDRFPYSWGLWGAM